MARLGLESAEEENTEMTNKYADLAGQVALITGGAGAIGRAISKGLVQAGAQVALYAEKHVD